MVWVSREQYNRRNENGAAGCGFVVIGVILIQYSGTFASEHEMTREALIGVIIATIVLVLVIIGEIAFFRKRFLSHAGGKSSKAELADLKRRKSSLPETCGYCGQPMEGRRCLECGACWCSNCSTWNETGRDRCGTCEFTLPLI